MNDTKYNTSPTNEQILAAMQSGLQEAESDRLWFNNNPGERIRVRPSSNNEIKGANGIAGSVTHVLKTSDGALARIVVDPNF